MTEKYYNPLSDMSRIKVSLMSLFCDINDITRLIMPNWDNTDFTLEQNWYGGTFDKNSNGQTESATLIGHCFDIPYTEGVLTDNRCAIFIETSLINVANQHIKEVGVDITVLCHKDSVRLSEEDKEYYESLGIYGNRVDSAVQLIHSSILNHQVMEKIKEKYSIGDLNLIKENPVQQYVPETEFYGKVLHYTYQSFYKRRNHVR